MHFRGISSGCCSCCPCTHEMHGARAAVGTVENFPRIHQPQYPARSSAENIRLHRIPAYTTRRTNVSVSSSIFCCQSLIGRKSLSFLIAGSSVYNSILSFHMPYRPFQSPRLFFLFCFRIPDISFYLLVD